MNEELNAVLQKQIIGKDDPRFEFFSDDFYGDFYDFFLNLLRFKQLTNPDLDLDNLKLILYLNVHPDRHNLIGKMTYSYKLGFDSKLNFLKDESEFSLNGLMKEIGVSPDSAQEYERVQEQILTKISDALSSKNQNEHIEHFNVLLGQIFQKYNLNKDGICYRLLKNKLGNILAYFYLSIWISTT